MVCFALFGFDKWHTHRLFCLLLERVARLMGTTPWASLTSPSPCTLTPGHDGRPGVLAAIPCFTVSHGWASMFLAANPCFTVSDGEAANPSGAAQAAIRGTDLPRRRTPTVGACRCVARVTIMCATVCVSEAPCSSQCTLPEKTTSKTHPKPIQDPKNRLAAAALYLHVGCVSKRVRFSHSPFSFSCAMPCDCFINIANHPNHVRPTSCHVLFRDNHVHNHRHTRDPPHRTPNHRPSHINYNLTVSPDSCHVHSPTIRTTCITDPPNKTIQHPSTTRNMGIPCNIGPPNTLATRQTTPPTSHPRAIRHPSHTRNIGNHHAVLVLLQHQSILPNTTTLHDPSVTIHHPSKPHTTRRASART